MRNHPPLVVLVSARPEAAAPDLGRALVDERLTVCVNVVRGLHAAEDAPAYVQWVRESNPIEGG